MGEEIFESDDKIKRVLDIYTQFICGCEINVEEKAQDYKVSPRSIQRDISDVRCFLREKRPEAIDPIQYDPYTKSYRMEPLYKTMLTNSEILAVCKILLDSRALLKEEMKDILNKLVSCCVPQKNQKTVVKLIQNELYYYVEPQHKTKFMDTMWDIGQAIQNCRCLEIHYNRIKDKATVVRKVIPVAIMFSEYYFYLTAFINDEDVRKDFDVIDDSFPTIYRIDRIKEMKVLDEKFYLPNRDRFEEGEFRKRIQFMYGGKLQTVKFKYSGENIEAVLDRLPTAKILEEKDGVYTVSAEVFGKGIDMWLRSQGENVEVLEVK